MSNPALADGGVIRHHFGNQGGVDLVPEVHGWDVDEPVAEITVERIASLIEPEGWARSGLALGRSRILGNGLGASEGGYSRIPRNSSE